MEMTYDTFLDAICHRSGIESADEAEELAMAVLRVLGEVLLESDRRALANELADPLRSALCERRPEQDFGLEEFYERVGEEEQVHEGRALEMAQVVGRTIRRAVDGEVTARLRRRMPEFEEVFVNPHADAPSPEPSLDPNARPNDRTLARGRPGSEEPVSEAKPPEGQSNSVAAQDNPYGDSKIATGHESTEEDEQTLAGGEPGSERPVSDTHEEPEEDD